MGTLAAIMLVTLAVAPLAAGEEQTRESYKAAVEPICKSNRDTNDRIMAGARKRVNKNMLEPVGKQFIRLSESFGKLVARIARVPAPAEDSHRVDRWLEQIGLLKTRVRVVGKHYKQGEKIKGNHAAILAERAGIGANNTSIVFHLNYCRFGRFDRNG